MLNLEGRLSVLTKYGQCSEVDALLLIAEALCDIRDLIEKRLPEVVVNTVEKPSNHAQIQLFTEKDFPIEIMENASGSILWWDATATKWRPINELTLRAEDENSTAPASLNITEESMGIGKEFLV